MKTALLFTTLSLVCIIQLNAKIWQVGPTRTYTVPSAVAGLVSNGDTVEIDAGTYSDCATWNANNLLLMGVGSGYAHIENQVCGSKGVWVIYGKNITIENMEFSGAVISNSLGENGAGIREQGGSFTVRNCYIHNNQDGILESPADSMTDILIENTVFAYNGCDTGAEVGYEHNMYINHARSFTLRYCYTHGAKQGHNIKTRAYKSYILYNRISDNNDGTASRDIDIPNGGQAVVMGNVIEKGPNAPNSNAVEFGLEGFSNPSPQDFYLVNNTFIDDRPSGCLFIDLQPGTDTLKVFNNIFAGNATFLTGSATVLDSATNIVTKSIASLNFVNAVGYNYNLMATSPAINKGSYGGGMDTLALTPVSEYVDSASEKNRVISGKIDIGAYEYNPPAVIDEVATPNFFTQIIQHGNYATIYIIGLKQENTTIGIYDLAGRLIQNIQSKQSEITFSTSSLASGVYILKAESVDNYSTMKFFVNR